jgi:DNA-binding CsgD family transcriptional regulator
MNDWLDKRTRAWAVVAVIGGLAVFLGLELLDEPDMSITEMLIELLKSVPIVVTTVGMVVLFRVARQQRVDHEALSRGLKDAHDQGERWRSESRLILEGLSQAIARQFRQWNLTDAEREVALLLLKGLSSKEIALMRGSSERTVREQARAVYAKAGLNGRAALSAYFLEDLLAPPTRIQ